MIDSRIGGPVIQGLRREVRAIIAAERSGRADWGHCDAWLSGYDPAFSRKLGSHGLIGMTWPKQFGGHGRSQLERYTVLEELLAAGAPVAAHWIADRQTGPLLLRFGTDAQRTQFLPAIARGECYFSIGMSEPDIGSDLASVRTAGRRVGGGWSLNGTKVWTSHAHRNHYMVTLVRTSPANGDRHSGLSQLIVDLHAEGVQVRPITLMSGEAHFSEVILDDAFVPESMLVGCEGEGWKQVTSELAYERSGPERFLSTFPLLAELKAIGQVNRNDRQVQAIGELTARLWSLRAFSLSIAERLDSGDDPMTAACMLKDIGTAFEADVVQTARLLVPFDQRTEMFENLYQGAVMAVPGFTLRGGTSEMLRTVVARTLSPQGPVGPSRGLDHDVARLLLETATSVFSRQALDPVKEAEKSGLLEVAEVGLVAAGIAVRASAYYGAPERFAQRVFSAMPAAEERGALMTAVLIGGAMARARDLTIEYARDRHQFGQPLLRFQAVQHQLAQLAMEAAASDHMTGYALADPRRELIGAAKVVAGRAASRVAAMAHQVHGAIGVTQEHPLHRFTASLWRWRDDYGTEAEWALELGRFVETRDLWEETVR